MTSKEKVIHIRKIFANLYPDAGCSLTYISPLELLISTQLSAQCTDNRVNIVTKTLFMKYRTIEDFANANPAEFENDIHSTGFFRNKTKNIISCCKAIIHDFGGKVPNNMDDLLRLPGVGRKTANLVLGDVYGIPGIVVDTHCIRLSHRIGLTKSQSPVKIEKDLMKVVPKDYWTLFCHQLVLHGRAVCMAKNPKCTICPIGHYCNKINLNKDKLK